MEQQAAGAERRSGNLPIFYDRPRPLNAVADQGRSLQPVTDFGFARATNSIVLGAAEFPHAMHFYPIVFTGRAPLVAVAVLGLEDNDNLFVGEDGKWREGRYVTAYVRRYPFLFLEQPEKNELVLCIDEASGLLRQSADRPLFEDEEPAQLVRDALAFCRDFNEQTIKSAAFVGELAKRGLLVPNQARIGLASGTRDDIARVPDRRRGQVQRLARPRLSRVAPPRLATARLLSPAVDGALARLGRAGGKEGLAIVSSATRCRSGCESSGGA